ncbi:MAG: hypothetical protein KDB73_18050 [Planctomycetes bacterium]|nr:hypothetical protein [Planctomycetota bacterium]
MSRGDDDEDPWDVLGVTPDDDDATVRAAYARLLRQFRPERDPVGFQRVQRAYEAVRRGVPPRRPSTPHTGSPASGEDDDGSASSRLSDEERARRRSAAWTHAAEGETARAEHELAALADADDGTAIDELHLHMLRSRVHGEEAATAMLVRRMTAGRPAAVVLLTAVEPERLVPHLLEDTFRCTALLRVAPPRHALELHARRVDHALATGHAALLADELGSDPLAWPDAASSYGTSAARRVAAVLAWDDVEAAERLMAAWPAASDEPEHAWTPTDHFESLRKIRGDARAWVEREQPSEAWVALLRAGSLLPTRATWAWNELLAEELAEDPAGTLRRATSLADASPAAARHLAIALELEPGGAHVLGQADAVRFRAARSALKRIDDEVHRARRPWRKRIVTWTLWLALTVPVHAKLDRTWWYVFSIATLLLLEAIAYLLARPRRKREYAEHVRPRLLRLQLEQGLPAQALRRAVELVGSKGFEHLDDYETRIDEDTVYELVGALTRTRGVRIAWKRHLAEEAADED